MNVKRWCTTAKQQERLKVRRLSLAIVHTLLLFFCICSSFQVALCVFALQLFCVTRAAPGTAGRCPWCWPEQLNSAKGAVRGAAGVMRSPERNTAKQRCLQWLPASTLYACHKFMTVHRWSLPSMKRRWFLKISLTLPVVFFIYFF